MLQRKHQTNMKTRKQSSITIQSAVVDVVADAALVVDVVMVADDAVVGVATVAIQLACNEQQYDVLAFDLYRKP